MSWFYSFITAICVTGVILGALYHLVPEGKMNKTVRYAVSLCFLVMLLCVTNICSRDITLDYRPESFESVDVQNTNVVTARYVYALALKNAGINFSEIRIETDNSDDGSITIKHIIVFSDADPDKILSVLGQAAENYEVEVRNE